MRQRVVNPNSNLFHRFQHFSHVLVDRITKVGYFVDDQLGENVLEHAHHVPFWVKLLPLVMAVGGLAISWSFYIDNVPKWALRSTPTPA